MAIDLDEFSKVTFDQLFSGNRLRELDLPDKKAIIALLQIYLAMPKLMNVAKDSNQSSIFDDFETAAKIAGEAGKLGGRIQNEVLNGRLKSLLGPIIGTTYQDLPARLTSFSKLEHFIEVCVGKPGHKSKVQRNELLVMVSELVRYRTGQYYDEQLAELIQILRSRDGMSTDKINSEDDISGESICKRREHLRKAYPLRYQHAFDTISRVVNLQQPVAGDGL